LESPTEQSARIAWAYANAIHGASDQVILVRPALSGDEGTVSHPLAHQLNPLIGNSGALVKWSAERLLEESQLTLARRNIRRDRLEVSSPPRAQSRWALPASIKARLAERLESATSFDNLIDCQLRWVLLDVFRLSQGRIADIPDANQLLGNLAHEIATKVFQPGTVADSHAVQARVNEVFDELLGQIAAPLQQPEHAGELATARARVPAALADLARLLRHKELEVVGMEEERSGQFGELAVIGRLDLLVRHRDHGVGVIDLKWSRSATRRRKELADGRAIQLATYSVIAEASGQASAPGAYYLLNQRRLIGPRGSFVADEEVDVARSLDETWAEVVSAWRVWRTFAADGVGIATGLADVEDLEGSPALAPGSEPCIYCKLTRLCRVGVEA
jgi:RecB family exonuclease